MAKRKIYGIPFTCLVHIWWNLLANYRPLNVQNRQIVFLYSENGWEMANRKISYAICLNKLADLSDLRLICDHCTVVPWDFDWCPEPRVRSEYVSHDMDIFLFPGIHFDTATKSFCKQEKKLYIAKAPESKLFRCQNQRTSRTNGKCKWVEKQNNVFETRKRNSIRTRIKTLANAWCGEEEKIGPHSVHTSHLYICIHVVNER